MKCCKDWGHCTKAHKCREDSALTAAAWCGYILIVIIYVSLFAWAVRGYAS